MRLPERVNVALELVDSHIRLGRGNKAAILCGEQTVSYANLHDSVNRVGNALIDMGVRREERVAILLPDRPEWAFAFFGAIKIGAVAVPLNTMLAPEDCQYVINDSGARVLVVDRAQLDRIAKIRASLSHVKNVIVIDDDVDGCASMEEIQRTCSPSLHAADTSQSDMAFWLYSSGTTAVPKGVIHRHRDMIVAADQYAKQTIGLRETDVSFSVAKLFFAYGLGNGLYFPLRCGGTTVLLPDAALPETVFDIFDRHQPTVFYSVPTSYAGLLHTAEKTGRTSLGRVRMCVSAGETLPKIIYEKWHERFGVEILDGIGSTEMLHIYISNRPGQVKAGSTGTLVPGYEAKILDEDGHEVPTGVVGRLLVKGESAAAGYWNRDDDTRETFRGGWLDSRDSFKVDEDGFYWYAGRSDDMIKVAGQAVWPARVESILQRHPAVVECAVAGAPGPDGLIKPRAAVVLNQGYKASPELVRQLQHFVRKNASPHECPDQVTFVEKLPKTATGKIQRFKLRKSVSGSDQPTPPPQAQADGLRSRQETSDVFERISHAPPARRMELLASHLQRELERILYLPEPPALDAGFSELGMDSLRAVEFRDLLQSQFGHQLTLSSTLAFDYPSVNQLARHLVDQLWPLSNNAAKQSHRRFDPSEPLAVIGLACRFPGAPDSEAFWQLLENGVDAISEVPADRWDIDARYDSDPDKPGKMSTRYGGFLRKVDCFDAELFGIASREAARMDPQHRLLLEVGWEALENAGIAGRKLRGSNTGVFVGVSSSDYAQLTGGDLDRVDFYVGTGSGPAYAAGRLSYFFGLQGPSQVVDTTCSSSLVSVHQACQSLRSRECDLALAGGVNLMLTPDTYVFLSRAKALAPDGRCKTFDAAADGFSRSEGCGLVVLKRWSDARRDGDRVLALIRGSAVNHDGPSGGLTVPHGPSQQQVIRNALSQAGCKPSDVSYLEAHGTGTKLGDPIEIQAAAAVFGHGRSSDQPLLIGSVKTNIGHLEAAAGIAGLIKVVLAIQHGVIPKQLHFEQPNPHIPWDRLPIRVSSQAESWPSSRRLAGVSAFGFSGTNAHVLLEGPPAKGGLPAPKRPERSHHLLVLSADRDDALRELAGRYSNWLEKHPQASLENVCFTASTGRSHLEHRAALVAQSSDQLARQLARLQMGRQTEGVLSARAAGKLRTAWVFAGQGIQHAGIGHELYQTEPGFREVFDTCAEMLAGWLERPLQEAVFEDGDLLHETIYAEPALFALEMALARLWQDWGVEPDVVVGHGVGQYAAACVAGALSLQDGLQLVAKRAELKNRLSPGGAMVEPDLDEFEAFAALLTFQPAERTLICTLTGQPVVDGEVLDAVYWRRHASEPEQFEAALAALADSGVAALLEIGPHPMLQEVAGRIWPTQAAPTVISSLRSGVGDVQQTVEALAALYVHGVTPDFEAFDRPWPREKISLPTYPFQRQRYWIDTRRRTEVAENPPPAGARVEELLYEFRWQAQSRGDANRGFLGTPAEIKRCVEGVVDPPGSATQHLVDPAWRADLDDLSCRYILEAFQRLGGPWAPGKRVALDTLAEAWGVDVGYRQRLLDRLLSVLSNAGWIGQDETKWHLPPQWPPTEANQRQRALLQRHPQAEIELKLLGRCGERIDDALTGKVNPLELLFPKQGLGAHDLYRESSDAAACNLRIRQLFEQATASLPSGRRLRVLEIGAGTGGTTASVLPVLPAARCDYVFTDVTPAFFASAARQFAQYPFVSYRTLDAEKDLESQGFGPHQFDIVLACNVLHVTRDIEESVRHIRQLLAPGGWLVLLELVQSRAWLDATFGLLEGWWRFDDRLRSNNALIDIEGWDRVLGDEGFIVESLATHGSADQALFLAQAPFQLPASEAAADHDLASWLILADQDGVGDSLAEMFCQRGLTCRILKQDDVDDLPSGFDDVQAQFGADSKSPLNIVHLWNLDIDSAPGAESIEQAERSALVTASLMQAVQRWTGQVRLWFVTRGSQSVLENESTAPQQALLWGMASVACLEMPEFCHGQIDLPLEVETADLEVLRDTLLDAGGEDKLAIRGDGLHVARVVPMSPSHSTKELALGDDESFLISGGLGQLGLQTAQWLAERGAKHLILNTRRPLPDTDAGWNRADPVLRQRVREVESLRQAGVAVHILAADVSDAEALREALQRLEVPPLRGVIHAAGVPDFRQIGQWSPESLRTALAAKVNGAWNLHELTADSDLRFFVNFSSASSVWGAHSQGAYAAANAFLDALARYRRAEGLPALSVNWARWSIGATTEEHHRSMQAMGLRAFRPAEGLAALGQLLTRGSAQAIVADVDWDRFKAVFESRNERHLFAEIATATSRDESDDTGVVHSGLVDRLRGAEPFEQMTLMVAHLQLLVSEVLDDRTAPSLDKGFFDLGVDSLMAVEIRNRIDSSLGADPPLPSSLVFDHPTIRELARHLLERFNRSAELPDKPVSPVATGNFHRDLQEPVAIIGLSCQFPGAANVEEYWELLREGRDAVRAVPSNRWEARREVGDALDIDCGGFLDNIDLFDPAFFGIPPRVAANIDPQQRLLLEMSWNAFENAAIPVEQLAGSAVGVFVGISQMEYGQLLYQRGADLGIHAVTGIPLSAAAGRLSYTFGFRGPALALDTSCSSSLTAVHQACNSLRLRECDTALAAGVNVIATPRATRELAKTGMLSPDGRCKTFDDSADGFGRGEGCGVVLLKRLSDAQADGNSILAVIRGSACNHDGATSGFTVPSGPSQERVIATAIRQAGVRPETIDYLEAHGTGTRLGDPIEIQAAAEVLGVGRPLQQPLLIGSVKTNLGHLEAAAGIAGLIKVVLAMQNRLIPKQLHFNNPSSHIPWDRLPVKVVDEATPWPQRTHAPLAGVSAMGASGTNVHVVVEGPPPLPRPKAPDVRDRSHHILTLSAKTPQALRELAERYLQWQDNHADAHVADVCHAAATGRSHFQHRAALVVTSVEEMRSQLENLLANRPAPGMFMGNTTEAPKAFETAACCLPDDQTPMRIGASLGSPNADYEMCRTLAQKYVSGANIPWAEWDAPWPRQRLSLPTYPFQRKRYWLPASETKNSSLETENIASDYYDALTTSVLAPDSLFGPGKTDDAFLTFVPFPEIVPGFSWIRTFAFPEDENNAKHRALVFREQQHMRRLLFRHVDFSSCRRVLDFGCGYGSDLIRLGNQHPHLKIDGYTISGRQREIIEQKIAGENLQSRVRAFHRDSARDEFPERYDLIFGIEVACHIKNKDALFGNVARHLSETGTLVLADFISEAQFAVDDPSTSSYLITREEWAQLLSRRGLAVVECIDAGEEVANSLYEPDRVDTLRELNRRAPEANVNRGIESYVKLGEMLRKGLMRYVLLTVRQATSTGSELLRANQAALCSAVPYRDVAPHRWLYELTWQASRPCADVVAGAPNAEPERQCASGTWLVLADQGGVGRALANALEQRGGNCCIIEAGSAWRQVDENRWQLRPDDHAALARLVREAVDKTGTPIVGVVHLWSLDDRPPGELTPEHLATAGESGAKSVLPLLQTLLQYPETGEPRFWFVTRGTVATEGAELPDSLASSCVWGLGRVFSLENSHLWGGLIDLPAAEPADKQAEMVLNELLGESDEDQVAYANGKRYVPRLVHTTASPPSPFKIEADATYLITGGLGALGGHVAQWLVRCGARNLVLCGRHPGHDAQARWAADHPDAAGCNVRILSADVAREEDVQQLLQIIELEHPPLRGVVHAAGVIGNERLAQMTATGWDEVLRPKLQGAWILHRLTEHLPLDFFVCFSSIAAIWGSAGQAHYAAGNAFLDALCRYRHLLGLPALSINWGPITGGGMLDVQSQKWLQERGVHAMTPEEALEVLDQLLGGEASQMVAAKVDWPRFKATYGSARRRPLLDCLAREDEMATSQGMPYPSNFVQRLRDVPAQQRPDVLQAYVRQQIASTLGLSHEQITPRQGLFDVGMDSLNAVELRKRFNTGLGVELPPTLLFDHPTVESLVAYLTATLPMAESTTMRTETGDLWPLANDADLIRSLEEIGDMDENFVRKSLEAGRA